MAVAIAVAAAVAVAAVAAVQFFLWFAVAAVFANFVPDDSDLCAVESLDANFWEGLL